VANRQSGEKEEILSRLRRVEGQIRGIQRMIQEKRDCEAIITQLMAARAALDKAGLSIVIRDIERCLASSPGEEGRRDLDKVIEFFLKFAGHSQAEEMQDQGGAESGSGRLAT